MLNIYEYVRSKLKVIRRSSSETQVLLQKTIIFQEMLKISSEFTIKQVSYWENP